MNLTKQICLLSQPIYFEYFLCWDDVGRRKTDNGRRNDGDERRTTTTDARRSKRRTDDNDGRGRRTTTMIFIHSLVYVYIFTYTANQSHAISTDAWSHSRSASNRLTEVVGKAERAQIGRVTCCGPPKNTVPTELVLCRMSHAWQ